MTFDKKFDAVVGRLVLMYHPRPPEMLRHLAKQLRPGGLLIFHEIDTGHLVAEPSVPLYHKITSIILQSLRAAGADEMIGLKLHKIYVEAGLPAPRILITGRADGGPDSPAYDVFVDLVRTLLPAAEKFGIVKPGEINLATLADELRAQVCAGGGIILSPLLVGAWSRRT